MIIGLIARLTWTCSVNSLFLKHLLLFAQWKHSHSRSRQLRPRLCQTQLYFAVFQGVFIALGFRCELMFRTCFVDFPTRCFILLRLIRYFMQRVLKEIEFLQPNCWLGAKNICVYSILQCFFQLYVSVCLMMIYQKPSTFNRDLKHCNQL